MNSRKKTAPFFVIVIGIAAALASSANASWFFGSSKKESSSTSRSAEATLSSPEIHQWCSDLKRAIVGFKWKIEPCDGIAWKIGGTSVQGRPIVYAEFGDPQSENTTLVLSMVHGDEITPVYVGIELVHWMKEHPADLAHSHVVIAPLVNPDGFYRKPRTRMNARGVDVNRNFATDDWNARALNAWKNKYRSDPRRYPGSAPTSEPETAFQVKLIHDFHPKKILSIHSPLNHLDYDGPNNLSLAKFPSEYVRECLRLRKKLNAVSTGFFPGSLGNYAGNELGIPTVTLELPTANPAKAESYWNSFRQGIRTMIDFNVPTYVAPRESSKNPVQG